jgi:hypothetical protein
VQQQAVMKPGADHPVDAPFEQGQRGVEGKRLEGPRPVTDELGLWAPGHMDPPARTQLDVEIGPRGAALEGKVAIHVGQGIGQGRRVTAHMHRDTADIQPQAISSQRIPDCRFADFGQRLHRCFPLRGRRRAATLGVDGPTRAPQYQTAVHESGPEVTQQGTDFIERHLGFGGRLGDEFIGAMPARLAKKIKQPDSSRVKEVCFA